MEIIIYGTPTCHWCKAAKTLLEQKKLTYEYRDLTTMKPVDANNVVHWSGMKTVPIVYDGPNLIGGFDALDGYIRGKELGV